MLFYWRVLESCDDRKTPSCATFDQRMTSSSLEDRIAIVTGANSGIGEATATVRSPLSFGIYRDLLCKYLRCEYDSKIEHVLS